MLTGWRQCGKIVNVTTSGNERGDNAMIKLIVVCECGSEDNFTNVEHGRVAYCTSCGNWKDSKKLTLRFKRFTIGYDKINVISNDLD